MSGRRWTAIAVALLIAALGVVVAGVGEKPGPAPGTATVAASAETEPVPSDGDAADDPAIWVHPSRPAKSVVLGTDKLSGIGVYDLAGEKIQYRRDGDINNVDLRTGFPLNGRRVALVAVTNRSLDSVGLYRVDRRTRELRSIDRRVAEPGFAVNGICMYRSPGGGQFSVFVTGLEGEAEQWRLRSGGRDGIEAERVRRLRFETTVEACVADDRRRRVYFGEEKRGIWKLPAEPGSTAGRELIAATGDDARLVADVEGLAIARRRGGGGTLIASSQGNDSYAVYRRGGANAYLRSFVIGTEAGIDGVQDTDGLDVTTANLGPRFRHGLLAVQDGDNDDARQNFKLVPLCRPGAVRCTT